jgi:uncharacterized protein YoxC
MTTDLDKTITKLNNVIETVEGSINDIKSVTTPVGEIGRELGKIWGALKETEGYVSNVKGQLHAFTSAVKVTFDTFIEGMFRKKTDESQEKNKKVKEKEEEKES